MLVTPQMVLMTLHLKIINWNAAVQYHPIQCLPFLCNTYHRKLSVRFMERLVFGTPEPSSLDSSSSSSWTSSWTSS